MSGWKVELLNETVEKELWALSAGMQARFLHISELLMTFGPQSIGMPHVRSLGNKLWEMRLHDATSIGRAVYIAVKRRRLVVLHLFVKKTEKTPRRVIDLALKRAREIEP